MTALDHSIRAFAAGHAAELTPAQVFILGEAAAIVSRVHASLLPPLDPEQAAALADRPAPLPDRLTDDELAALRDGLRGG